MDGRDLGIVDHLERYSISEREIAKNGLIKNRRRELQSTATTYTLPVYERQSALTNGIFNPILPSIGFERKPVLAQHPACPLSPPYPSGLPAPAPQAFQAYRACHRRSVRQKQNTDLYRDILTG